MLYLKKLEKEEPTKLRVSRRKEIMKIRAEVRKYRTKGNTEERKEMNDTINHNRANPDKNCWKMSSIKKNKKLASCMHNYKRSEMRGAICPNLPKMVPFDTSCMIVTINSAPFPLFRVLG